MRLASTFAIKNGVVGGDSYTTARRTAAALLLGRRPSARRWVPPAVLATLVFCAPPEERSHGDPEPEEEARGKESEPGG